MYECIRIQVTKYSFLKKDRFVSCCRLFELPLQPKIIGQIDQEDLIRIYNKIQESKRLSPIKKKLINPLEL